MSEPFIGRKKELKMLTEVYEASSSAFIPIYGRRRVGKSELILKFMASKPGIYFLGKKAPREFQMAEFLEVAARTMGDPLLASYPAKGWKDCLEMVFSRWTAGQKLVLVLDEFQWTVESSPELPSILQEMWDRRWKRTGNVFFILCGSFIGFMEKEILGKKSPLYGRRTAQIFLKPFDYREAAQFHPRLSLPQKAMVYFVCGGIPMYLHLFSDQRSVIQNIEGTLLNEFSPLFREPDFLLREELREVEKYYIVMMSLSSGAKPSRVIAKETGIDDRSLHYYLQNLVELGYLKRTYPLWSGGRANRNVRFEMNDALLRFWFRFIYPHFSSILRLGPQRAMSEIIKRPLDAYFGSGFENLCREALPVLYEKEGVSGEIEVGQYWDKNVQIDVVGQREDGVIDLGECKWGNVRSIKNIEQEIAKKVAAYPNPKNATIFKRLFLRDSSPSRAKDGAIRQHVLADLYR